MSAIAWAVVVPAVASALIVLALRRSPLASRLADHPNERSLHGKPTPRIGGIGIVAAALPWIAFAGPLPLRVLAACAAALALVSLADDFRSVPIEVRLPAHAVAALAALLASGSPAQAAWGWMEIAVALFAVVWMTNLFNFMDGSDGLAGGMAVIGFGTLAFAAHERGFPEIALACAAVASASAGFLPHNFPPARVFMGDAGSVPLGFLAAMLGVLGVAGQAWPAWFPVLVFSPFIVDATVTILRRLARRERIWVAHRSHCYQRLVLRGWTPRRLALAAYALMLAASASALLALGPGAAQRYAIIFAWIALYAFLLVAADRFTRSTPR